MRSPALIFFRGLNSYGHDHAQLSVLRFGFMFKHMQREIRARGIEFHPVLGMGMGPLSEVTARARTYLESLPAWIDPDRPVRLIGHSAGGLVARLLLDQLKDQRLRDGSPRINGLLTIATPHRGSALADIMCALPTHARGSTQFLKWVGFDLNNKLDVLRTMTPESVRDAMAGVGTAAPPGVRFASIVCAPSKSRWSKTMRGIHLLPGLRDFDLPSDGIVERASQPFGDEVTELTLDHFQQAGFCGGHDRFLQMCDVVRDFAARE